MKKAYKQLSRYPISTTFILIFASISISSLGASAGDFNELILGERDDRTNSKWLLILFAIFLCIFLESQPKHRLQERIGRLFAFLEVNNKFSQTVFTFALFLTLLGPLYLKQLFGHSISTKIYGIWGVSSLDEDFADLRTTLIAIDCPQVNRIGDYISCGDRGNNWLYSEFLLLLRGSGIGEEHTWLIGNSLALILFVLLLKLGANSSSSTLISILLFALTPGVQLLLERGNLDLLFVCIFIAISFISISTIKGRFIIYLLLLISTLTKFYTFPCLVILCLYCLRKRFFADFTFLLLVISALLFPLMNQALDSRKFGVKDLSGSYGLQNLWRLVVEGSVFANISSILIVCLSTILMLFLNIRKSLVAVSGLSEKNEQLLLILTMVSVPTIASWLLAMNYFYRQAFIAIALIFLTKLINIELSDVFLVNLVIVTWLVQLIPYRFFSLFQNSVFLSFHLFLTVLLLSKCSRFKITLANPKMLM